MTDAQSLLGGRVLLYGGDCLDVLAGLEENSVDAVVTDPPYHLTSIVKRFGGKDAKPPKTNDAYKRAAAGFMQQEWDGGDIAFRPETWRAVKRVLKPGGYMVAFASTRGFGRMSVAIEDAGFVTHPLINYLFDDTPEILRFLETLSFDQLEAFVRICDLRDGGMLSWIFGQGFPKATKVKLPGYEGWRYGGQALKPACEPIYMGQKPFSEENGNDNIARWGTGAINIADCRIETEEEIKATRNIALGSSTSGIYGAATKPGVYQQHKGGRWPANVIHDGSPEVVAAFPDVASGSDLVKRESGKGYQANAYGRESRPAGTPMVTYGDAGSASRFYYTAKADAEDRLGSKHPSVKPVDLKQYLCRLITPRGGIVLDPFAGTGTTGEAAWREGMSAVLIEREQRFLDDIGRRMDLALKPAKRAAVAKTKNKLLGAEGTPLFGGDPE